MTSLTSDPLVILHEWVQSESLRKHCYAVADSMKHFAILRGDDAEVWEAVGLLHDMDYERSIIRDPLTSLGSAQDARVGELWRPSLSASDFKALITSAIT